MKLRLTHLGWITTTEGLALCLVPAWQTVPLAIAGGSALLAAVAMARLTAPRHLASVQAVWSLPRALHAGNEVTLGATISAADGAPPMTLLAWDPRTRTDREVARLAGIGPLATCVRWTTRFPSRGLNELPPLAVACEQPFGLVRCKRAVSASAHVVVLPALGRVRAALRARLAEWFAGVATATELGNDDLGRLRAWAPGDPPTRVHWRASARHRALLVAERHAPAARRLAIVLDPHAPAAVFERLVSAAATLIDDLSARGWELHVYHGHAPRGCSGARDRLLEVMALCHHGGAPLDEVIPRGVPCLALLDDATTVTQSSPAPLLVREGDLPRLIHLPRRLALTPILRKRP